MQVRWTSAAAEDLESIANYLFEKTPESAARLIREIYNVPSTLKSFPKLSCASFTVRRTGRDEWQLWQT